MKEEKKPREPRSDLGWIASRESRKYCDCKISTVYDIERYNLLSLIRRLEENSEDSDAAI